MYVSVGIPGVVGLLQLPAIATTGLIVSTIFILISIPSKPALRYAEEPGRLVRLAFTAISTFFLAFIAIYANAQAYLPVISNDAITYHFPAAAQWLRHGRIDLFQTWFFNPANTYSPLAGSMFIVWLMAPFHSVVLARFVEVPPLLGIGLAIYCIARQLVPTRPRVTAALVAAMAVLARPIFLPSMMGKDDLFVAFYFLAAVNSLARDTGLRPVPAALENETDFTSQAASTGRRPVSQGMADSVRAGIAIGLMLATKYTALLCIPVLLLAIGNNWKFRQWASCGACIALLAGPWYLRNWSLTGNPLFPLAIDHLAPGLFTTARSDAFHPLGRALQVVIGGQYGVPPVLTGILIIGWLCCWLAAGKRILTDPLLRMCMIGPVIGIALFFWRSPFPEVRFLLPFFLLLIVSLAMIVPSSRAGVIVAGLLPFCSLATLTDVSIAGVTLFYSAIAAAFAAAAGALLWWAGNRRWKWTLVFAMATVGVGIFAYINWSAYSRDFSDETAYSMEYPPGLTELWRFVNQNIPANATVAYTNLYLISPMQQGAPQREFIYAPTRPGVKSIAYLGWLGNHLSGEKLVQAAVDATHSNADRSTWLRNMQSAGAQYIVIGHGNKPAPEAKFVRAGNEFQMLFDGDGGEVWKANLKQPSNGISR